MLITLQSLYYVNSFGGGVLIIKIFNLIPFALAAFGGGGFGFLVGCGTTRGSTRGTCKPKQTTPTLHKGDDP